MCVGLKWGAGPSGGNILALAPCYNNGVTSDGAPDPETVTRASRMPDRASCVPVACAAGKVGAPCSGEDDDASCDSQPSAGDGSCDA